MATANQQKPILSSRHGYIDAAVWENHGKENRIFHNVTLKKSWKDGEEWKNSSASFGHSETLAGAKLLDWADDIVQAAYAQKEDFQGGDKPFASKKHRSLEAAVWQKMEGDKLRYRVCLKRSYKDGEEWKSVSIWLLPSDCLAAARVLTRTFDAIDQHVAGSNSSFVETAKQQFNAETAPSDEDIPF